MMKNFAEIGSIIGRPVIAVETANRLGVVGDLIVHPGSGQLAGLKIDRPDQTDALVSIIDVHGLGPHAIMIDGEQSLLSSEAQLNSLPKAKKDLTGVRVLTDTGQFLGKISRVFLCLTPPHVSIYEVRSSILGRLLGHALYFPASLGGALSADATAFVVNGGTEKMAHTLDFATRHFGGAYESGICGPSGLRIEVRTRAH